MVERNVKLVPVEAECDSLAYVVEKFPKDYRWTRIVLPADNPWHADVYRGVEAAREALKVWVDWAWGRGARYRLVAGLPSLKDADWYWKAADVRGDGEYYMLKGLEEGEVKEIFLIRKAVSKAAYATDVE